MSKQRNLDFQALANAVDQRDAEWLAKQPEAARKEFGKPAMRFIAGVKDGVAAGFMLWLINQRVNYRLYDLSKDDKDLSYRLLASCGLRRNLSRTWLAAPSRANAAHALLATQHPNANDDELRLLLSLYTREEFVQFIDDCGVVKADAKACLDAYDQHL